MSDPCEDIRVQCAERLTKLETNQDQQISLLTRIHDTVCGTDDKPGHETRLDRLEQSEGRRTKAVWLLVAGVVALIFREVSRIWR